MNEETTRSFEIDDEGSLVSLLKILKNADGISNVSLKFGSSFPRPLSIKDTQKRSNLVARASGALKVNQHVRELTLFHLDDLDKIDEILVTNKTITKLVLHAQRDRGDKTPALKVEAIRSLLQRGPQIEIYFEKYDGLVYADLAKAIPQNSTLTALTLTDSGVRDQSVTTICKAVKRCSNLSKLAITFFLSLHHDDALAIAAMLQESSTLTELTISHNGLGQHLKPICDALQTNTVLKKLDLGWNSINSKTERYLAEMLRTNSTLTELRLPGNCTSSVDIFQALQENTTLTILEYDYGGADESVHLIKASLAEMIQCNSTLTELTLGNVHSFDRPLAAMVQAEQMFRGVFGATQLIRSMFPALMVHDSVAASVNAYRETVFFERALEGNQSIRLLNLSQSYMSYKRVEALGHALKNNKSLVELWIAAHFGENKRCLLFCEGLKFNRTLRTLWIDEASTRHQECRQDVGSIAIADALTINTGLVKVTMRVDIFSTECLRLLAMSLERNTTLKELVLHADEIDEDMVRILATGLALNTSLKCFDLSEITCEGAAVLADWLTSNSSLEELKIWITDEPDFDEFANALKVNTSLKRLWLDLDESDGQVLEPFMEAYEDNPALMCEFVSYHSKSIVDCSWFYYRLNRTGRLAWPDSTFPASLWPRALALADLRSSPECPDVLFHFILTKPDIFRGHCEKGSNKEAKKNKKRKKTKKASRKKKDKNEKNNVQAK